MDRRSFLKLALLTSTSLFGPRMGLLKPPSIQSSGDKPNVLLLVFDAWSARNNSVYGYSRTTTPNLETLSQKATVYHQHYSPGNFTKPGTGSLLSGVYPWRHRGFQGFSQLLQPYSNQNIFSLMDDYTRMAYSQNPLVNVLFEQFINHIDDFTIPHQTAVVESSYVDDVFRNDFIVATKAELEAIGFKADDISNTMLASLISRYFRNEQGRDLQKIIRQEYPKGPISIAFMRFLLDDTIDWAINKLKEIETPFFSYMHFFPPHDPYRPRADFLNMFKDDGWTPIKKPRHPLSGNKTQDFLNEERQIYDAYIAFVDSEIGRMFALMEKENILENTIVILTSDHGEMFERGIFRHSTPTLFESIIHIPLMIFEPGQTHRKDVYQTTVSIDIIPSILKMVGKEIPAWLEGMPLPPYHDDPASLSGRSIFAMDSRNNKTYQIYNEATFAMFIENFKLIHYYNPPIQMDSYYELYDLKDDPEELNNLYFSKKSVADEMVDVLYKKIAEADEPFRR